MARPVIVVGIDGSDGSLTALRWALHEADLRQLSVEAPRVNDRRVDEATGKRRRFSIRYATGHHRRQNRQPQGADPVPRPPDQKQAAGSRRPLDRAGGLPDLVPPSGRASGTLPTIQRSVQPSPTSPTYRPEVRGLARERSVQV